MPGGGNSNAYEGFVIDTSGIKDPEIQPWQEQALAAAIDKGMTDAAAKDTKVAETLEKAKTLQQEAHEQPVGAALTAEAFKKIVIEKPNDKQLPALLNYLKTAPEAEVKAYLDASAKDVNYMGSNIDIRKNTRETLGKTINESSPLKAQFDEIIKNNMMTLPNITKMKNANAQGILSIVGDKLASIKDTDSTLRQVLKAFIDLFLSVIGKKDLISFVKETIDFPPEKQKLLKEMAQQLGGDTKINGAITTALIDNKELPDKLYNKPKLIATAAKQATSFDVELVQEAAKTNPALNQYLETKDKAVTIKASAANDEKFVTALVESDTFKNIIIKNDADAQTPIATQTQLHAMMLATLFGGGKGAKRDRYDKHMEQKKKDTKATPAAVPTGTPEQTPTASSKVEVKVGNISFIQEGSKISMGNDAYDLPVKSPAALLNQGKIYDVTVTDGVLKSVTENTTPIDYKSLLLDANKPLLITSKDIVFNKNIYDIALLQAFNPNIPETTLTKAQRETLQQKALPDLKQFLIDMVDDSPKSTSDTMSASAKQTMIAGLKPADANRLSDIKISDIKIKDGKINVEIPEGNTKKTIVIDRSLLFPTS